jgi:tetratricopeptide (TPR) repeat protein
VRQGLGAIALVGLLVGTAAGAALPSYDTTKRYATEAEFVRSIQPYQVEAALNPRNPDATYWLGYAYWETSIYYRNGWIDYGADYLDKSIAALERTVSIDDKYLTAWLLLISAYHTRGQGPVSTSTDRAVSPDEHNVGERDRLTDTHSLSPIPMKTWALSDEEKSDAAAIKAVALGLEIDANARAVPANRGHGAINPQYVPLPDRRVKFNPADYFAIGDRDTMLVYRYPCATLPPIKRAAFFLTKWEAFDRGYKPGTVCRP